QGLVLLDPVRAGAGDRVGGQGEVPAPVVADLGRGGRDERLAGLVGRHGLVVLGLGEDVVGGRGGDGQVVVAAVDVDRPVHLVDVVRLGRLGVGERQVRADLVRGGVGGHQARARDGPGRVVAGLLDTVVAGLGPAHHVAARQGLVDEVVG